MPNRTRERILNGAAEALARHGVAKLGMSDVSVATGVSRGTLYRYFATRDELLNALTIHEGDRYRRHIQQLLEQVPAGEDPLGVVMDESIRYARTHPALSRMRETDLPLLFDFIRVGYPQVRKGVAQLLGPLFKQAQPVRDGQLTVEQLADWFMRSLLSNLIFPAPDGEDAMDGLRAMQKLLIKSQPEPLA